MGRRIRSPPRLRLVRRHVHHVRPGFAFYPEAFPARGEVGGGEVYASLVGISSDVVRHIFDTRVCGFCAGRQGPRRANRRGNFIIFFVLLFCWVFTLFSHMGQIIDPPT